MAITERNEVRKADDGRMQLFRVSEDSETKEQYGAVPVGEVTLGGAGAALAELYARRGGLAAQLKSTDTEIEEWEAVKKTLYEAAKSGG
jgi:hypothetical protein